MSAGRLQRLRWPRPRAREPQDGEGGVSGRPPGPLRARELLVARMPWYSPLDAWMSWPCTAFCRWVAAAGPSESHPVGLAERGARAMLGRAKHGGGILPDEARGEEAGSIEGLLSRDAAVKATAGYLAFLT